MISEFLKQGYKLTSVYEPRSMHKYAYIFLRLHKNLIVLGKWGLGGKRQGEKAYSYLCPLPSFSF